SIDFEAIPIYSKQQGAKGEYCAIGTIRYSEVDGPGTDGILIYIKPAIYGTEPTDVYHYAQENRDFPQEPTSDQWFSEAQFESYRMLGLHAISRVWDPAKPCVSMEDLVGQIKDRLARRNGKGAVRRDGTQRRTRIAARPTLRRGPTRATLEPTRRPPSPVEHTPSHHTS
ncbi:MAG TPA: hypothetical protein VGW38_12655, partial [Chloroflexota bacterium]|nr:hypothetical protein [Chloroflexota bacterium]